MSKNFELMQQLGKQESFETGVVDSPGLQRRASSGALRARASFAQVEAFQLAQQIFLLQGEVPPKVVVFAGVDHGSGCSRMSAAVAEILAKQARRRVCLVEANFRTPALPGLFGTIHDRGLADAILHTGDIKSFAKAIDGDNLWLLSAGALTEDSPSLLTSEFLPERMNELRENFEFILIDAPPLIRYSDAVLLGQQSDGIVLVLEAGSTRREVALAATASLRSANIPVLAAVLNKRTLPIPQMIYDKL